MADSTAGLTTTCPIAGWAVGPSIEYDVVAFKLKFVTRRDQKPEQADHSQQFVLSAEQAIRLAESLIKAAQDLRNQDNRLVSNAAELTVTSDRDKNPG